MNKPTPVEEAFSDLDALKVEIRVTFEKFLVKRDFADLPRMVTPDGRESVDPASLFRRKVEDDPDGAARLLHLAFAMSGLLAQLDALMSEQRAVPQPSGLILPGDRMFGG